MNANTTAGINAAAQPDTATMLDWILELEQRLRVARLRVAIEGDHAIPEVYATLADLAAAVQQKLT